MGCKVLHLGILLTVLLYCNAITVSSNGNSPRGKMPAVSMKDIEFGGFVPINPYKSMREERKYLPEVKFSSDKIEEKIKIVPVKKHDAILSQDNLNYLNNTQLPVNERYRRLIPYMTFYLANDFNSPQKEVYTTKPQLQNIVIPSGEAANGKQVLQYNNVPKYQGNRLTNFNIASAFPSKIIKDFPQKTSHPSREAYLNNARQKQYYQNVYDFQNPIPVPVKVNYAKPTEFSRLQYYSKPKYSEKPQQYKLIPYEQTPPVQVPDLSNDDVFVPKVNPYYKKPIPVPVAVTENNNNYRDHQTYQIPAKETYTTVEKPRNEIYYYTPAQDNQYNEPNNIEYISEPTYRFKKPYSLSPITESGFKPMINTATPTPATKFVYITSPSYVKQSLKDHNYKYVTTVKPKLQYEIQTTKPVLGTYPESSEDYADLSPNYGPSGDQYDQNNLAQILKTLQDAHSLPQTITTDNVDSSIKTLVQIINNLKSTHGHNEDTSGRPIIEISSTYKPPTVPIGTKRKPHYRPRFNKVRPTLKPTVVDEYHSQDLETEHPGIQDIHSDENDSLNDERGGTPGRPGIDYPTLATIPVTQFDCKEQRYKGFFGDPETSCQVWHYCDLNGGKASFLCPNGTVFSQVALTCDWWFNVKCDTTAQLYVLNERLYKYILPYTPKFPEDYSGPLVDKYLSIKYKEMEEEDMKKKEKAEEENEEKEYSGEQEQLSGEPENVVETEQVDVIEIKTSGMSGALRPYGNTRRR